MRVAVIDLGTFSAILLIAESKHGRIRPLHEERHTVDLEYGVGRSIASRGIQRAVRVLRRFNRKLDQFQIDGGLIVATAAIRHARNRLSVVKQLRAECQLPLQILSAKREAGFSAAGALIGLPHVGRSSLIIDIGGGSSEFINLQTGLFRGLPIGAAWATKAWSREAPRERAHRDLHYLAASEHAVHRLDSTSLGKFSTVVGIGGTITTLAAVKHRMQRFDVGKVHGTTLSRAWIDRFASELAGMSQKAIGSLVPFDPTRARVLLAGTYLWSGVLNRLNADRVTVSARGLRWGVAAHLTGMPRGTKQAGNDQKTP